MLPRVVVLVVGSCALVAVAAFVFRDRERSGSVTSSPREAATPRNDPDDIDPARVSEFIDESGSDEADDWLASMNWCGTGIVDEGAPIPDDPSDIIRVRVVDAPWKRLHERLLEARLPSERRILVRAFLVERTGFASASDAADRMEELAGEEPYARLRDRLERASAALRDGTSWETAFDTATPTQSRTPKDR